MQLTALSNRLGLTSQWSLELGLAVIALLIGFGVMPLMIYWAGTALLGRYDGASASRIYDGIYAGLAAGSPASFTVVLGPYALYLLFTALKFCWRAGSRAA